MLQEHPVVVFFLLVYSVAILPIQSNQGEEDPKACWQPSEPCWPDLMIARMLGKDLHPGRAQAVVGRATRFWDVPSGYSSPLSQSLHAIPQSKYFSGPQTFEKPTPGW